MKQIDILKMLAKDMNAASQTLLDVNKALKAKDAPQIKYRLSGKSLGHYGFTGLIKALTETGVKVYEVNKVSLIPFPSIETMEKAKPREKRPLREKAATDKPLTTKPAEKALTKPPKKNVKPVVEFEDEDEDDFDSGRPSKSKKNSGHTGSKYIPRK